MTPLEQAGLYFGLAVAVIAFCFGFFYAIPWSVRLIGRFFSYFGELGDRNPGIFVIGGVIFGLAGFCLLCVSTTWLHITDKHLFEAGVACVILCAAGFIAAE